MRDKRMHFSGIFTITLGISLSFGCIFHAHSNLTVVSLRQVSSSCFHKTSPISWCFTFLSSTILFYSHWFFYRKPLPSVLILFSLSTSAWADGFPRFHVLPRIWQYTHSFIALFCPTFFSESQNGIYVCLGDLGTFMFEK